VSSGRLAFASPTLLSICPLPWEPGLSPTTIIMHACLFSVGSLCFNEDVQRVSVVSLHCFCVMRYRWNTASRRPSSAGGASGTSVLIRYYGSSRRNGGEIRCAIFSYADDCLVYLVKHRINFTPIKIRVLFWSVHVYSPDHFRPPLIPEGSSWNATLGAERHELTPEVTRSGKIVVNSLPPCHRWCTGRGF
jgi:hypothetical protein